MQISNQQVEQVLRRVRSAPRELEQAVKSLDELASRRGVEQKEAESYLDTVRMAEPDPFRERRVEEIAARVAAGTYQVSAEEIVDMAERRAMADRAADL